MRSSAQLRVAIHGMREIVEAHGPEAGDGVVDTIAARLEALVGERADLQRTGDTQFVVACSTGSVAGAEKRLADRLCRSISEPVRVDDVKMSVTASVEIDSPRGATSDTSGIGVLAR